MILKRKNLYRFPWSMTDNPGGWINVTDSCNLSCHHCFRRTIEGHRPLQSVLDDIVACQSMRNCDDMKISGGEPLTYPHLLEVVKFIAEKGMKPFLMTNGVGLDISLVRELAKAGLSRFNFHIDSSQNRVDWEGQTESQLNHLRQSFADMVASVKGIGCGFNVTVTRDNLDSIPDVVGWAVQNIDKVHHMTLIALRGIVVTSDVVFFSGGKKLPSEAIPNLVKDPNEVNITGDEILKKVQAQFPDISPSGYLNGSAFPETKKYLVSVVVGSRRQLYGSFGPRALELVQVVSHLTKGRYISITKKTRVGRKVFLLALMDSSIRKALSSFLRTHIIRPWQAFERIYIQPIAIEQPIELMDGEANICDGCINMMIYQGRLIPSCRVEEYRTFGGPLVSQKII